MGHRLFLFILILLTSVVSQAETKKAGWGYKAFPIVKPEGRDLLPLRVSIGRQVLRARLRPGAGTHRQLGIEQLYTDRFYKKRIHVKKQVQVTGDKVIGGWRQVAKGYVLHLSHQGSTTAFYATGLDARERFFFESQVRKLYPVARVWNPFLPAAFAETTSGGGRVSTTDVTQAQVPWVLSSLSVAAGATTCYLARGGENFMEMAQGAAEGVRGVIDDPGGAWQSAKNWVSETADSAVTGVANAWENRREIAAAVGEKVERGYEAVANGANYVVDGVMDGTIWEDIGNATTQTLEYLQRLGTLAVEQIQGFAQLPDYAKAQILCEMAIQMTGEGIATLVMAATGAGAALAIPRVAAFFARFGQMMVQAFPEIQYIISLGESLSEIENILRMLVFLRVE